MTLTLHFHPFASYCQKALIALYENDTAFERVHVDLGDPASAAAFKARWPIGKFPVLVDDARGVTLPESSIVIEYLDHFYPGPVRLLPDDPDQALQARLKDRFFDFYVQDQVAKIVIDRIRPPEAADPPGVAQARAMLDTAYGILEREMESLTWATGEGFTLADCAAAPALSYAEVVHPFSATHPNLAAYLQRLRARPSHVRVLKEAEPYWVNFPQPRD